MNTFSCELSSQRTANSSPSTSYTNGSRAGADNHSGTTLFTKNAVEYNVMKCVGSNKTSSFRLVITKHTMHRRITQRANGAEFVVSVKDRTTGEKYILATER